MLEARASAQLIVHLVHLVELPVIRLVGNAALLLNLALNRFSCRAVGNDVVKRSPLLEEGVIHVPLSTVLRNVSQLGVEQNENCAPLSQRLGRSS